MFLLMMWHVDLKCCLSESLLAPGSGSRCWDCHAQGKLSPASPLSTSSRCTTDSTSLSVFPACRRGLHRRHVHRWSALPSLNRCLLQPSCCTGAAHIGAMYTAFLSVAMACGTPGLMAALALGASLCHCVLCDLSMPAVVRVVPAFAAAPLASWPRLPGCAPLPSSLPAAHYFDGRLPRLWWCVPACATLKL